MSVVSGYFQGRAATKAANKAADAQQAAAQTSTDELRRQFDTSRSDMAPWQSAGTNALYQLQSLLGMKPTLADWQSKANADREKAIAEAEAYSGPTEADMAAAASGTKKRKRRGIMKVAFNPAPGVDWSGGTKTGANAGGRGGAMTKEQMMKNALAMPTYEAPQGSSMTPEEILQQDPSYKWRFREGQKGVESSAAAGGNLFSGRAGKALQDYGQSAASTEFQNIVNRLAGLSGTGQSAATTAGGWGQQTAGQIGNNALYAGNAVANAALQGSGGSRGFWGGVGNVTNKVMDMYANKYK